MTIPNSNLSKIIANYVGKLWNMLSAFIFIPVYIHFLGIENYAIIGFSSLILGIISFADAGMSSAITREFALEKESSYKEYILKKVESVYWIVVIALSVIISINAELIARNWLNSDIIPSNDLINYIILLGIGSCLQLVTSLYFGAMFGLGRQVEANLLQILWTTSRTLLLIIIFYFYTPSLYLYFIWQIICNLVYIVALRTMTLKTLKQYNLNNNIYKGSFPRRIIKYISGMLLIALISSINSQADKIVVSYLFDLKIFGYYTIVSIISQIPVLVSIPMASFAFPLLSKFSDQTSYVNFTVVFNKFSYLLYFIVIPIVTMVLIYPLEILLMWTQNTIDQKLYSEVTYLLRCLTIGSAFLALQIPFYYTLLAYSQTKYTVYQGFFQLILGVPLLIYCSKIYGLKYVGITWLLINLFSLMYLMFICFSIYLRVKKMDFITRNVLPIFLSSIVIGYTGYAIYKYTHIPFILTLIPSVIFTYFITLIFTNYKDGNNILSINHIYNFPKG